MSATNKKLIEELNALGLPVGDVSDLYNEKYSYKAAIPLLLSYLDRERDPARLEEIVRALSVKWAKPAAAAKLVALFPQVVDASGLGLRWVIGNALSVVATEEVFDEVVRLVTDRKYGRSREMLPLALAAMNVERADNVLIGLLDDPQIVGHVLLAIRKRKVADAYARVLQFADHPTAWIRKEARKTIETLDATGGRGRREIH